MTKEQEWYLLRAKIEEEREKLNRMVVSHPQTLIMSQRLDVLLNRYLRLSEEMKKEGLSVARIKSGRNVYVSSNEAQRQSHGT